MIKKKALYLYGVCKGAGLSLTTRALYKARNIFTEKELNILITICLYQLKYKYEINPGIQIDRLNNVLKSDEKIDQSDFRKLAISCFEKSKHNKKVDRDLSKIFLKAIISVEQKEVEKPKNYGKIASMVNVSIAKILKLHKEAVYIYGFAEGYGLPLTKRAVLLANRLHFGQKRKDGRDYIEHPVEGCRYLINLGNRDDVTLAAELLHDVLEDCAHLITYEELKKIMGESVAKRVLGLTKHPGITEKEYREQYGKKVELVLNKAVDKTSNICDMVMSFGADKLEEYTKETEEGILPIMKQARNLHLEYSDILITLRDRIKTVLIPVKEVIKLRRRVEILKKSILRFGQKIVWLEKKIQDLSKENQGLKKLLKKYKK